MNFWDRLTGHARDRMQQREVSLSDDDAAKIEKWLTRKNRCEKQIAIVLPRNSARANVHDSGDTPVVVIRYGVVDGILSRRSNNQKFNERELGVNQVIRLEDI